MAKILIVDDDVMAQLILQELLESEGYEVAIASDGEEGLQMLEQLQPNLIICDWMMPGLDGLEVCRRAKASPELATTFFILLTARELVADRVKGLDAGADDFLLKPIEPEELQARVRAGLRLQKANQELAQALKDLRSYQAQLVQSEKMSSLGQLVAGIAHEINNPVTFIYSNLNHVQDYAQDLIELLQLYQQHTPHPDRAIAEKLEAIDWEFLIDDLPKLLDSMQVGADRIRQIVLSLRDFSRLDRSGLQKVDVHACIDNTLLMLQHRLLGRDLTEEEQLGYPQIEVIKEYGDLPLIECYAGQFNQALLDILRNAVDALEELFGFRPSSFEEVGTEVVKTQPKIRIRTEAIALQSATDKEQVSIRIADNGSGMDETTLAKIFNPFFTTKPVGKGTGLGLSICYQIIVQQHAGELECSSHPGKGTEFIIKIPVQQQ